MRKRDFLDVAIKGSLFIRMVQRNVNYVYINGNRGQVAIVFILYSLKLTEKVL